MLWCIRNFGRETISIQFTGGTRATARAGWCTLACRRWTAMSVMMLWQGVASVDSDILLSQFPSSRKGPVTRPVYDDNFQLQGLCHPYFAFFYCFNASDLQGRGLIV